jgi:hypothetical protein
MNRIRGAAAALGVALLLAAGGIARAQETTGRVTGRVTDKDTGMALGGVTVVLQGPQGEDATLTDDKGVYNFTSLPVGLYVIRFYVANAAAGVEQNGVVIAADKMVRVNAQIAGAVQAQAQEKYVITGKPPVVDIGSARVGANFNSEFMENVPLARTYGDVIERAPGAFVDPSGNVSIGGATGLENIYIVNGVNVTGIEYGNLEAGTPSIGGGTNLPLEFFQEVDVSAGGYQASLGGGMGGVINSILKSGTNEFHGSAFGFWAPYWASASPNSITTVGGSLGYVRKPDFDSSIGVEVGGPIIKDKLFFWTGFSPRFQDTHVFRQTYALQYDPTTMGAAVDANGNPISHELVNWRARIPESRQTYYYAATLDWFPRPEHHLSLAAFGSPNFNDQMRSFNNVEFISDPAWAQEKLTKSNSDFTAHWTSKLFDHRWQIDALLGLHTEYFYERSPNPELNNRNQLEYWGANLSDLEHAPGCEPIGGFQPCPVDNYHTGGFGTNKKASGARWMADLKSTHLFDAGGHHEIAWGWHPEYVTYDQDRWYSGPLGNRALVQLYPTGGPPNFNTYSLFTLQPGEQPSDFGALRPATDLLYPPDYRDDLKANVSSIVNAFFLQENYSPPGLRNLTINAGARLEFQKLYDFHGQAFLDATNVSPRVGAIWDPRSDGRSKVSFFYGRYYEAIPLNVAARYFGGEGILQRNGVAFSECAAAAQNPYAWNGSAEYAGCNLPPKSTAANPNPMDNAGGGSVLFNNGSNYAVQSNLAGQYHNEVVATAEREIFEDTTVRLDYQHRWLGTIIEDGAGDQSTSPTFVLANPGHIPQEALDNARQYRDSTQAALDAELARMVPNDPMLPALQSAAAAAQARLTSLQQLANAPKPQRTYDAITISANKRFAKRWLARASYTYSRLIGNYDGLYQAEQNYFAPNGNNAYDTPDLYANQNGPLPNDRPHLFHLDGFYTQPVGRGAFTFGLSFAARSGMPRNYVSGLVPGQELVMLLPRGSGGRTPTVTELNGKLAYRRALSPKVALEAFIDLFNMLNQQTVVMTDDNYTYSWAGPIVNGTPSDLKYAKDISGAPIVKNPNYGNALLYQRPFSGRFGLRLTF